MKCVYFLTQFEGKELLFLKKFGNTKYTTIAVYVFLTLLFAVLCVFIGIHFEKAKNLITKFVDICSPLIFGAGFAYILNPLTRFYEEKLLKPRRGKKSLSRTLRRILAILLTFLSLGILFSLFLWMILPHLVESITDLIDKFPDYIRSVQSLADSIAAHGGIFADAIETALTYINTFIDQSYDLLKEYLPLITGYLQTIAVAVLDVVLGFVFAIYFLFAKENLAAQVKKILHAIFSDKSYQSITEVFTLADKTFSRYFTGAILDSLLVGIICFIFMTILGLPYASLISVIIAVTNIIPIFGPFIGAIPSALILFVASPLYAIYFVVLILVLQQIDGNIIAPKIHGASTGLAPVWVITSITIMSGFFGIVGMFVGVPLFSVVYTIIKQRTERKLREKNLSTATMEYMSPEVRKYYEKPEDTEKKPGIFRHIGARFGKKKK